MPPRFFVQSYGSPDGFRVYVVAGAVQSKTIYLTAPTWDTFTMTKGSVVVTPSPLSDTWTNSDGHVCNVYKLDGEKDDDIVEYGVTRYNDTIKVIFDFDSILDGEPYNGTGGVNFFSSLKSNTLRGDNSLLGLGNSQMAACGGADEKTIYLAVYANSDLSVSEYSTLNNVDIERVGTWMITNDEGGVKNPFKVYYLTVKNPGLDMNSVASFFVTREYTVTVGDTDVTQDAKIHPEGDVTGDGSVNILDVNRANLHYKNKSQLPDYEKLCADVDGNGSVNILDVNRLNLHYKNKTLLW